ncbi:F0F1 ATP synthase subunit delta [Fictibacillus barbaricus]|uniref:ATP synthase subunit delta n=1 Tax=Fictibacillus barbaricus TaxID=182136 RepID=A0ABU1U274_9BACL|nr:F0F1 ATP synthase subunit delta [Fictibacillus barbaricus]MDR7073520.1 F-type H+-transporting ATPase subunit delta [Fictibacillus barbaricus]
MSKDKVIVAKRYALALYEVAGVAKLEETVAELRVVKHVLESNKDLQKVLSHPKVTKGQKKELIKESIGAELSTPVMNTIFLMVDRNRYLFITEMAAQFIELANEAQGIADAQVYSVRPLTDDELQKMEQTFAAKVGKRALRINNIVDPSLVGGVKIRIGNRIFDGSISGKLNRMERQLASHGS